MMTCNQFHRTNQIQSPKHFAQGLIGNFCYQLKCLNWVAGYRSESGFSLGSPKNFVQDLVALRAVLRRQATKSLRQRLPMHLSVSTRTGGLNRAYHNQCKTHGDDRGPHQLHQVEGWQAAPLLQRIAAACSHHRAGSARISRGNSLGC